MYSVLTLNLAEAKALNLIADEERFFAWLAAQSEFALEKDRAGNLLFMTPTHSNAGKVNGEIVAQLAFWNKQYRLGVVFDSSTGFRLPNGAIRSPDAAWIRKERWNALSPAEKNTFAPLCPDFVVELRSPYQPLHTLHEKMQEYRENGALLGWLFDLESHTIYIYEPHQPVQQRQGFTGRLSAEPHLPGFELDLDELKSLLEE
ncbi:MAG: hypothetical protein KatS3mg026_1694 [Bacteroidia bacterium]|nr:MAG: hypothetical protein KatS3mg026_1694 [Bacteroidia bacterium]